MIKAELTCIGKEDNCQYYTDIIEVDIDSNRLADVFKQCRKYYGRCINKVYIDLKDNTVQHIGYVFEKNEDGIVVQYWVIPFISIKKVYQYLE